MNMQAEVDQLQATSGDEPLTLLDIAVLLARRAKLLVPASVAVGIAAVAASFMITPTFTAHTSFLPPQQQGGAASALASLGALSSLAGAAMNIKKPAEEYVALMQSTTVADRIVDQFDLMKVYRVKHRVDARKELKKNAHIEADKNDALITVDVDDTDPQRAAAMANRFVEELRRLTSRLAVTEAQQRRVFFQQQLEQTEQRLKEAQQALQASGLGEGAIKAEPKAAAEGYAALQAQVTAAEVRLQALRQALTDQSPEVQRQMATVAGLRQQLARLQTSEDAATGPDYISKYRDFKYQDTLFDIYARQYEMARLDEGKEGGLIQVVDPATPPEVKSRPKRALIGVSATLAAFLVLSIFFVARQRLAQSKPESRPQPPRPVNA